MKKLLYFLRPYKNKLLLMIGLLFIQVMGTLYIPTLTADIVNNGIVTGDLDHVWKTGRVYAADRCGYCGIFRSRDIYIHIYIHRHGV